QKYGNITAGDFYGEFACDLAYANLNVNKLFRSPVRISGRYANIRIDRVEVLNLSANYSRINISELDELYAKLKYTPASVGSVGKKLTVDAAYSSIKVGNTSRQLESAKFNCSYSNMDLRFDPDLSADLNINLKYGNLSVSSKYSVKYSLSETSYNKVIRKGTLGSSTPAASIAISSSYANVSIR
ncbi:MAG: hypothetical protein LBH60_03895, partial [Prevotellaceae bacterium]|nr:hypothetical protein [Prevotellaceae bacterium]